MCFGFHLNYDFDRLLGVKDKQLSLNFVLQNLNIQARVQITIIIHQSSLCRLQRTQATTEQQLNSEFIDLSARFMQFTCNWLCDLHLLFKLCNEQRVPRSKSHLGFNLLFVKFSASNLIWLDAHTALYNKMNRATNLCLLIYLYVCLYTVSTHRQIQYAFPCEAPQSSYIDNRKYLYIYENMISLLQFYWPYVMLPFGKKVCRAWNQLNNIVHINYFFFDKFFSIELWKQNM